MGFGYFCIIETDAGIAGKVGRKKYIQPYHKYRHVMRLENWEHKLYWNLKSMREKTNGTSWL